VTPHIARSAGARILSAITMPVSSPLDCTWDELRKALRTMWAQATAASNWMMTEM
jgi:hypothetical protein